VVPEEFTARYERSFRRVFHYVSRRVTDRPSVEVIVEQILSEEISLLSIDYAEREELIALKVAADRAIAAFVSSATKEPIAARVHAQGDAWRRPRGAS
jgi:hypothetical protein